MPLVSSQAAMTIPRLREISATRSWGFLFLLIFMMVAVGRIQEFVPFFAEIRLGLLTGALAIGAWLLGPGGFAQKVPLDSKQMRYILGLLALALLTIPLSVWPGNSFDYLTQRYWKNVLLFVLVLYWCRTIKDIRWMVWICCFAGLSLIVGGILSGEIEGRFFEKAKSYDPNDLCLLLVMIIPLAVYLYQSVGPGLRGLALGLLLVILYGIILTQSRGGFLSLLVAGGLMMWRGSWSRSTKLVVIVIAVVMFSSLAGKVYWDRIGTIWSPRSELDQTGAGRTEIWKTGLMLMLTRPMGVGIDGFETAEGLSHGGKGKWSAPHNSFLQVGAELSPVGLILFMLLLGHTIRGLRQVQSDLKQTAPPSLTARSLGRRAGGASSTAILGSGSRGTLRSPFKKLESQGSPPGSSVAEPEARQSLAPLAAAFEISLWSFMVGGFFLSQAYSALLYTVLGLAVASVKLAQPNDVSEQTNDRPQSSQRHSRLRVRAAWLSPALARRHPS
jgi:putative inorganic carbon (HCO3(-)) transporter